MWLWKYRWWIPQKLVLCFFCSYIEYQTNTSSVQSDNPKEEEQEIATLFLRVEVPEVSKHPYLKEEIIVKKKSITETKKISDQVRSEKVYVEGAQEEIKKEQDDEDEANKISV